MGSKSNHSRRYTEEFKRDAVALVRSSGKTVTDVAREIGVSAEGLRNWFKPDTIDRGQGAPGELTTSEREELRRLRRLAAEQAETIKVLRKAAVFFPKESYR
ncbi:transposase [Streptomyces sp. S3(2020)]|uniref:transposase n=1 Tax=Streptomyces sp. S3(2020) TaxID=2732044 RepID=UPI001489B171|nr:transposase [Streptomyces sp. S3(2020)]